MRRLLIVFLVGATAAFVLPNESPQAHFAVIAGLQPGGDYLTYTPSSDSPAPLLQAATNSSRLRLGRQLYYRDWVAESGPNGLLGGPGFDARSCADCHVETALNDDQVVPRIARTVAGTQVEIAWTEKEVVLAGGERIRLRKPDATLEKDGIREPMALRAPPVLFGWGLLENADKEFLQHFDDPDDRNGDGISGRMIADQDGAVAILGWNNSHSSVRDQVAAALLADIGVTSDSAALRRSRLRNSTRSPTTYDFSPFPIDGQYRRAGDRIFLGSPVAQTATRPWS